jgi:hypothetical protein
MNSQCSLVIIPRSTDLWNTKQITKIARKWSDVSFYQILLLRKDWSPYFLGFKIKYEITSFWKGLSSGIKYRVVRWKSTDVSEEYIASIFRVEEYVKQQPSGKQVTSRALFNFRPWKWRRNDPMKRRLTFSGLHGVISQMTELFITDILVSVNKTFLSGFCIWRARGYLKFGFIWQASAIMSHVDTHTFSSAFFGGGGAFQVV